MFHGMGHGVSAGTAQGEVKHHNLIGSNESRHAHDKDQVPEGDSRRVRLNGLKIQKHNSVAQIPLTLRRWEIQTHTDSLANKRDRERCLGDLLSN